MLDMGVMVEKVANLVLYNKKNHAIRLILLPSVDPMEIQGKMVWLEKEEK